MKKLDEWEKLCDEASPGPWFHCQANRAIVNYDYRSKVGDFNICKFPMRTDDYPISHEEWEGNARLIAEARTAMPRLILALELALEMLEVAALAYDDKNVIQCDPGFDIEEIKEILSGENDA